MTKITFVSRRMARLATCLLVWMLCFSMVSAPVLAQPSGRSDSSRGRTESQSSARPAAQPASRPASQPSARPTTQPTAQSSARPAAQSTAQTPARPSAQPTAQTTARPSAQPTAQTTARPSAQPTAQPAARQASPFATRPALPPAQPPARQASPFAARPALPPAFPPPLSAGRYGYYPPLPPPYRDRMSDFEKALAIIGTVGVIAAIANSSPYQQYRYYHYHYPPPPSVVVVERPVIMETQTIIETPVIIERQVPVPEDYAGVPLDDATFYSPKMGASFSLEHMEIPGYSFTAARLTSDPVEGSPLEKIGLQAGDVITRMGGTPVDVLNVLDQHEGNIEVRYIKSDTTKVLLAQVYIPTDEEILGGDDVHYAP